MPDPKDFLPQPPWEGLPYPRGLIKKNGEMGAWLAGLARKVALQRWIVGDWSEDKEVLGDQGLSEEESDRFLRGYESMIKDAEKELEIWLDGEGYFVP